MRRRRQGDLRPGQDDVPDGAKLLAACVWKLMPGHVLKLEGGRRLSDDARAALTALEEAGLATRSSVGGRTCWRATDRMRAFARDLPHPKVGFGPVSEPG